ncbi:hypothetical protein EDD18DRAFT_1428356 [Armillaria luteobubalina]|uniref:Nephrocystin 3-like N-terminal domain-containing protein n=1 Tax=Armillaria luteobubalina TaxID=153913 RepID=A0AA39UJI6_9AGAR|nr:hypothetical protein EDD18DRAFT_1428356 [Armillaria luteobubalina]
MAEVLGIASSITTLIENTVTVINYLKDVKNASKECDEFLTELQHLESCLIGLKLMIQRSMKDNPWLATLQQFHNSDGFKQLLDLLDGLKMKLKPGSSQLKRMWQKIDWAVVKDSVMGDLSRIERFKSLILIAGQHDNFTLTHAIQKTLGNIKDKVDEIRQGQIDGKAKEVAKWLTNMDYNAIQHDKMQQRTKDTGQWFLQSSKFLDWVDGSVEPSVLWCVGAGVGKTILASTTVNHLCMKFEEDETDKAVIFCIFCNYCATDQRTITIICSLLKRLIQACLHLTDGIQDFYDKWSHGGKLPLLEDITSLLSVELKLYDCIYIILDALDELDDDKCHEGVLDALKALGNQICLLMTSRPLDTMQSFTEADKIEI